MNDKIVDAVVSRLLNDAPSTPSAPTKQIVILQRGWIIAGKVTQTSEGITITNASVIRRWGTTKGIGQLAMEGKQKDTVLEPCGTVTAPTGNIIAQIVISPGVQLV